MDKEQRKAAKKTFMAKERDAFLSSMPLSIDEMMKLFEFVAGKIGPFGKDLSSSCDHTLRFAREWCSQNNANPTILLKWLCANGAGCDCEILWNVDERLEEALKDRANS